MLKLWCLVVGTKGTAFSVQIDASADVDDLKKAIKGKKGDALRASRAGQLALFLARTGDGSWLQEDDKIVVPLDENGHPKNFMRMEDRWKIGQIVVPELKSQGADIHVLVEDVWTSKARWNQPTPLCRSPGYQWKYQGATELSRSLVPSLVVHYTSWKAGRSDKQTCPLHLVFGGRGSGKSRLLDQMDELLRAAAHEAVILGADPGLLHQVDGAYRFNISFEKYTEFNGALLDPAYPELDISARMLYQLWKKQVTWSVFSHQVKQWCRTVPLTIDEVIEMVATCAKVENIRDMTVILCIDGLEMLGGDGTKTCDLYRVLAALLRFLNQSKAFAVCACSATMQGPVELALIDSMQRRVYMTPPAIDGELILATRTRLERQLVEDMGGHGRALEVLQTYVLDMYSAEELETMERTRIVAVVLDALHRGYTNLLMLPLFQDERNHPDVLFAVLSRCPYRLHEQIGQTGVTVDQLRSLGLFRWGPTGFLDCAFILVLSIMQMHPRLFHWIDSSEIHFVHSMLTWQHFNHFCASFRSLKSTIYRGTRVPFASLPRRGTVRSNP